ncbi:SDR family NAD(P)-dependent oxidoreductase [Kribbella sp. NPDC051620]|uniref:SDR family NAD(P)-dependent oxidoreductase n=1 Tax=Kribbella sp. NPDC051620 TaxID=3364120 RepID=UPI00378BB34D
MTDRVALITGFTSAIGTEAAQSMARLGFLVAVTGRQPADHPTVAKAMANLPATSRYFPADLTREGDVAALVSQVTETFGRLDAALNNAGGTLGVSGPLSGLKVQDWHRVVEVNLTSVMLCLKHQMRWMSENGGGSIVCTSGVLGHDAAAGMSAYVAAKHAVIGLVKAAALEGAPLGIRVNGLSPGMSVRNEPDDVMLSRERAAEQKVPLARLGTAAEIAQAAAWLLSEQASFVTGQCLVADGGWLAQI